MAFILRCWSVATAAERRPPCRGRSLCLGPWLRLALLLALLAGRSAAAAPAEVVQMRLDRSEDGLYLSAAVDFELPAAVEDALLKGVALTFVADAEVLRERWYWYDKRVAGASRHMRLSYQPLTGRWRVQSAAGPIGVQGATGLGMALSQSHDSLDEALAQIKRVLRWRIADPAELEPDVRHMVEFRFRLDTSQLPRPFQIGVAGQSDWILAASRSQRLQLVGPR